MTELEELQIERERIIKDFIASMNIWLTTFNEYTDKLIEELKETEQEIIEVRDAYER